ncbi:hypothetical protein C8Q75DRAFT_716523 [Abortiporus biennis]|nr:hypothetical protein C8Q75DRAFT_806235 [Abortiporus biennis]KAI0790864.1 hypothetical protein C8Q75DRAFT_716523 [Abortiporus biennis]
MFSTKPKASPIHPASLVDRSQHSPALLELLESKITRNIIDYVADCVIDTVQTALGHPAPSSRGRSSSRDNGRSRLIDFMSRIIYKADIKVSVLLVTLVYIERAKHFLHISTEQWANERVFLGAIMAAYKYVNDATLKNYHWSICTGCFGTGDVGRVEREFLDVLDYSLSFTEDDILAHHESLMRIIHPHRYNASAPTHVESRSRSPSVSRFSDDSSDDCSGSDSDSESDDYYSSSSSSPSLPATPDNDVSIVPSRKYPMSPAPYRTKDVKNALSLLYVFPSPPSGNPSPISL